MGHSRYSMLATCRVGALVLATATQSQAPAAAPKTWPPLGGDAVLKEVA